MGEVALVQIPNYVSAVTPQGLRRAMLMNNARHRLVFNYYAIQFTGSRWFAWFYNAVNADDPLVSGKEVAEGGA